MTENSQISNNINSNNIINNSIPIVSGYQQNIKLNPNLNSQNNQNNKISDNESEEELKINEINDKDKEIMQLKNNNKLLELENERLNSQIKFLNFIIKDNEKSIKEIEKLNRNNIKNFVEKQNNINKELEICRNEINVLTNKIEHLKKQNDLLKISLQEKDASNKKMREWNTKASIKFEDAVENYKIKNKINENNNIYLLNSMQEKRSKKNYGVQNQHFYNDFKYNKTTINNDESSSDSDFENNKISNTVVSNRFKNGISSNFNNISAKRKEFIKKDKNLNIKPKKSKISDSSVSENKVSKSSVSKRKVSDRYNKISESNCNVSLSYEKEEKEQDLAFGEKKFEEKD